MKIKHIKVPEVSVGQRIDNFLLKNFKGVPKSRVYRAIRGGEVRVNKGRVKADYRLQLDDEVRMPPLRVSTQKPPMMTLRLQEILSEQIIYEDKGIILLNKPSSIAVHGGSGVSAGVIEALRQARPHCKYLELIHRLDRDTSGCLLVAKKPSVHKDMCELFASRKIKKSYLMLVHGKCHFKHKRIKAALEKDVVRSGERIVRVDPKGREAITDFYCLHASNKASVLLAQPKTGRMHQLRVHAAYIEHPIIGDKKYGDQERDKKLGKLGLKRLYLHAVSLEFVIPNSADQFGVCAVLDDAFSGLRRQIMTGYLSR